MRAAVTTGIKAVALTTGKSRMEAVDGECDNRASALETLGQVAETALLVTDHSDVAEALLLGEPGPEEPLSASGLALILASLVKHDPNEPHRRAIG